MKIGKSKQKGKTKGIKKLFSFLDGLDSFIGIQEPKYDLTEEDIKELIDIINEPVD